MTARKHWWGGTPCPYISPQMSKWRCSHGREGHVTGCNWVGAGCPVFPLRRHGSQSLTSSSISWSVPQYHSIFDNILQSPNGPCEPLIGHVHTSCLALLYRDPLKHICHFNMTVHSTPSQMALALATLRVCRCGVLLTWGHVQIPSAALPTRQQIVKVASGWTLAPRHGCLVRLPVRMP